MGKNLGGPPHLLMVRLLDQLLGVIQFSDQGILKIDGNKQGGTDTGANMRSELLSLHHDKLCHREKCITMGGKNVYVFFTI